MPDNQPTYSAKIGERMRGRRWRRDLTIADVLKRLESQVDEATYSRWESGVEDIPLNMLPELAKALEFKNVKQLVPSFDTEC